MKFWSNIKGKNVLQVYVTTIMIFLLISQKMRTRHALKQKCWEYVKTTMVYVLVGCQMQKQDCVRWADTTKDKY